MRRDDSSPSAYLDSVSGELKTLISLIRELILQFAPDAEEGIEYGMLRFSGLAHLAAQKHYVSIYVNPKAMEQYKQRYPKANCGKCCLRFKSMQQFDEEAILYLLELAQTHGPFCSNRKAPTSIR